MTFTYYNIRQVFVDNNGEVKDKNIKRTMNEQEATSFFECAKTLKPDDQFYMYTTLED